MASPADAIAKFIDVTGTDQERAKFYLEATSYNLDVAIQHFFEERTDQDVDSESDIQVVGVVPPKTQPQSAPRIQTVANLARDSSSDEEEAGEAFFAGGSIHSGQQVLGPGRPRNQIVADMFRSVREHGGEVVNQDSAGPRRPNTVKFSGTGYRLGQTPEDSQAVGSGGQSSRENREVTVTLKMWRQGFSIDEGPLRQYNDPANMEFLKTVSSGVVPDELLRDARGNEVHMNLEDHSHEEYTVVQPKLKVFSGKGNILGSPVPGSVGAAAPASTSADPASDAKKARESVPLDTSSPTTSVQIRLADGTRLVASFNHSHTIGDVHNYITIARPEYAGQAFRLMTSFPSKELSDRSATLAAAGALNAALLQRLG